ncbi:MAG: hypothetical protein JWO40_627 [Candidatus Doudnabacteria bacterium]|nr:hypothetical protein [Candidatus Doudnabacteria bacterium]
MLQNIRNQLLSIFVVGVIFLIFTLIFFFTSDPLQLSAFLLVLFYLCLAACIFSFCALILYQFRGKKNEGLHSQRMSTSFRQSIWLTLLIVGSLILSAHQLLYWWLEIIFIITLIMLEGFFLSANPHA